MAKKEAAVSCSIENY